jgi:hypothetical protein
MNFIINLSSSRYRDLMYNAILIIINKFIKYSRYISVRKDWNAKFLNDVLFNEIFSKLDMFLLLVSDRESLFIFKY